MNKFTGYVFWLIIIIVDEQFDIFDEFNKFDEVSSKPYSINRFIEYNITICQVKYLQADLEITLTL